VDWLIEPFELAFQQRALLAGALASVALAVVGTWVVIRGMAFLGDALAHGVVPGIAVALLLDVSPLLGAAAAAGVMVLAISAVHRQGHIGEDTSIGLLFAGMLGLGVIVVSATPSYTGSLTAILFGDVLGVTSADLWLQAGVLVVTAVVSALFYRPFLVLAFNEQKAELLGLRPRLAHAVLLGLMTVAIIGSFQTVGTLLVFGLLVGPPATAALVVRRVPAMMLTAAVIGIVSVVVGLVVSYHAGTAGSATMAVVPVVLFFVVLGVRSAVTGVRRRESAPA
jgi:ABC-type Mn2+/Zn2+ transport system permease subunit